MTVATEGRSRRYHDATLRRAGYRNLAIFILALISGLVYICWLATVIDWTHPWLGGAFLLAEIICAVSVLLWGEMLTMKREHPQEGLPWPGDPPPVDVLIAVCHEPMEVFRPTVEAVSKINYPHFHVTILDDGQ